MSQTGYTPIQLYYSTTAAAAPSAGNLAAGELAINITDGKLYYKDNGGVVQTLAVSPTATGTANGVLYLNGSKVPTAGTALTFDGTNKLSVLSSAASDGFSISNSGATPATFSVYTGALSYGVSVGNGATGAGESLRFDPTAHAQIFNVSSAEQMRLTSTGLGIGTSSPADKLQVLGTIRFGANATYYGTITHDAASTGANIYNHVDSGGHLFQVGGTTLMNLTASGNLGLGVTPSAWGSGYAALQLPNGGAFWSVKTGSPTVITSANAYFDGTSYKYLASYAATLAIQSGGQHQWFNAPSGTAGNAITFTQAMTLDSSGRLSVNTTSPTGGGFNPTIAAKALTDNIVGGIMVEGSGADATLNMGYDGTSMFLSSSYRSTAGYKPLAFYTSGTERARIDSSGNFLVGRTSSSNSSAGLNLFNYTGVAGSVSCVKTATGQYTAWANYYSGTYVGGMEYTNTATIFAVSSDIRLKKDIVDAPNTSEKIDQIRIVSHGWKHDDATVEFGVIAQELYSIAPEAVTKGDDNDVIEKTWAVDYSKLVPMLVKEIQSLRKRLANAGIA